MKTVCEVLGVARSAVVVKRIRSSDWRDGRRARVTDDTGFIEEIQAHVAQLPTYGYRCIWALLRRSREQTGAPCVNAKRVYRVNPPNHLFVYRCMRHNFSRPPRRPPNARLPACPRRRAPQPDSGQGYDYRPAEAADFCNSTAPMEARGAR